MRQPAKAGFDPKNRPPMMKQKPGKTIQRLLSYFKAYKLRFIFVLICIVFSAAAGVASSLFIQILIDNYITPLLVAQEKDFSGLLLLILIMGGILLLGALATLVYNRMMVTISQGIQKKIRDEMFEHMQKLPVRYFDTHTHGDLMSRYTNDTDTLRQMLSMSVPQMFSSLMTIIAVFFAMLFLNFYLTLFVLIFVGVMMFITKKIASRSAAHFIAQQNMMLAQTFGIAFSYVNRIALGVGFGVIHGGGHGAGRGNKALHLLGRPAALF